VADPEYIRDLFAGFGPVSVRRMFSGAGIFADGLMFALVVREVIYLKVDDATIPAFQREGMGPFTYTVNGGTRGIKSYWRMPDRLYDDPDELARWAQTAFAIARRKAAAGPGGKVRGGGAKAAKSGTAKAKTRSAAKQPRSR
jgi:DNA transformation protein and related proteins